MSVFKYKFQVSQQTQLKSSHQKKLLQSLKKQYPFVDDEIWQIIFPSKSSVLMSKLSNKVILYSIKLKTMSSTDRIPIYFYQIRVNGKDCIYPTLYLLWRTPNFLPCICIHSPVSQFVLRGADLMLPGVSRDAHRYYKNNKDLNNINAKDLDTIKVNDVLSIKVIGNPLPVAIGYSILSSSEIQTGDEAKGRFMKMMHIFRDQLWDFGGKIKPNAGFLANVIKPIEIQQQQQNDNNNNDDTEINESKQGDIDDDDENENKNEENAFDIKFNSLSMDNKLIYGFFSTLLTISSSCLPVIVSDIYQTMSQNKKILQFKDIDVKQTSFNKLARFVQSKQFETFIHCKQQKSKVFIQEMDSKEIAKHLLLILNNIENHKFDSIIKWFQQNWSQLQQSINTENENNENNENNDNQQEDIKDNDDDDETQKKQQELSNEERFKIWYDTEYKSSNDNAITTINNLFGSWSNILECNDINESLLNHLSETFNIILSDNSSRSDIMEIDRNNPNEIFRSQFLETLKVSINPNQLPISASTLLTRKKLYILKPDFVFSKRNLLRVNLEQDIITSIKQTRWKKSSKFLKELTKQNVIQLKDYGNTGGELMITDINYYYLTNQFNKSKELQFFTPEAFEKFYRKINELKQKECESETKQNDNNNDVEETGFVSLDKKQKVSIQTMYRANHRLLPIFGADNISELHSKNKARTFLWSYVEHKNLVSSNKQNIRINDALFHMLYDSKMFHNKISKDGFRNKKEKEKLKSININSNVHRKDLVSLFDEYMQPYSAIILDDDETPKFKPGYPPKIEINADKRQGTKYMTHVIGLETYGIDINQFVLVAKKYFAAAVTISSLHGKKSKMKGGNKKQKVSIQGNMVKDSAKKDVPTLLITHYGIPSQFINAKTNITKQPKK